jgi:hypothetical protein
MDPLALFDLLALLALLAGVTLFVLDLDAFSRALSAIAINASFEKVRSHA